MEIDVKIKVLSELISGCEELSDYQDGWEKDIQKGYEFLKILTDELEKDLKWKVMNNNV